MLFDHYLGQGCFCAVLHVAGVVLVNESAILRQQQHKRLRRVCVVVRNLLECAAADGDGSAVNKLHVFKGTARNTQRAAGIDRPSTPVIETVLDGDGCTLKYGEAIHHAAADGHSAAVLFAGKFASVKISNLAALNRQGTF